MQIFPGLECDFKTCPKDSDRLSGGGKPVNNARVLFSLIKKAIGALIFSGRELERRRLSQRVATYLSKMTLVVATGFLHLRYLPVRISDAPN